LKAKPLHEWLHSIKVAFVPGPTTGVLEEIFDNLLDRFQQNGHQIQAVPDDSTDVLMTTAPFGRPLDWRKAFLFTARRRFGLKHTPTILTLMHVEPDRLESMLDHLVRILSEPEPDPKDLDFAGMAPESWHTLLEQGRRGGPIMALLRVLQAQSKSIRILLVVGKNHPEYVYLFDLVGSFPRSEASSPQAFYDDIVHRIATVASTQEITDHQVVGGVIPRERWNSLSTPQAMRRAGQELGKRNFFTEMVMIERLVHVPAVSDAVASQYSEGCFATWEPGLSALLSTVTGSSRPVDKASLSQDDLAVIVGVRSDGRGAVVRYVEGHRNDPPSSEAVEMIDMDTVLPRIPLRESSETIQEVPVARSKLHGHRGISAYDPRSIEFVPLDPAYYHYPVSCATRGQAIGIKTAFSRSQALLRPDDPRHVVFTVLPGHGVVIVEKWVAGKAPFQAIWEAMDRGELQVSSRIPQGLMTYIPGANGRLVLSES
ncbi:MAG TPA: hypothetical protein VF784_15700, partial [Anaerolineales bacterium]